MGPGWGRLNITTVVTSLYEVQSTQRFFLFCTFSSKSVWTKTLIWFCANQKKGLLCFLPSSSLVWSFLCIQFNVQFVFNLQKHKTHIWYKAQIKADAQARTLAPFFGLFVAVVAFWGFRVFSSFSLFYMPCICSEILLLHCSTCSSFLHCVTNI